MDTLYELPEKCRVCKNGKYKLRELNQEKASAYLQKLGITMHFTQSFYKYCASACAYAIENNEDPEQFYEINEYTCRYKDECKFANI